MPGMRMKSISRGSISDEFESSECLIPAVPKGGARIKVHYAGACYTEQQVEKSGLKRLRSPGVHDTSLFPGYEISGIVEELCNTVSDCHIERGDRIIVYPDTETEETIREGNYSEYICIKSVDNLIKIPSPLTLEIACLLPSGALQSYSAILRAKPTVEMKMAQNNGVTNMLIVGAGGLGLWTLKMAQHFICDNPSKIKITVADTNVDKLMAAKTHGCTDIIHWHEALHEEYLLERTRDVCPGGVDVIIDFVSSPRTVSRSIKVLNKEGVLLVGGNSKYDVSLPIGTLAKNSFSVLGVERGSRNQLQQLVDIFSQGQMSPPVYHTYPVDDTNKVFEMLNACQITGRAVLEICPEADETTNVDEGDFSVFLPTVDSDTKLDALNASFLNGQHIRGQNGIS